MSFLNAEWAQFMFGAIVPALAGWCGYLTREIDKIKDDNRNQAVLLSQVSQKLNDVHALLEEVREKI